MYAGFVYHFGSTAVSCYALRYFVLQRQPSLLFHTTDALAVLLRPLVLHTVLSWLPFNTVSTPAIRGWYTLQWLPFPTFDCTSSAEDPSPPFSSFYGGYLRFLSPQLIHQQYHDPPHFTVPTLASSYQAFMCQRVLEILA